MVEPVSEEEPGATLCMICCDYYREKDMFNLAKCEHDKFCKNCMADYLRNKISEAAVFNIPCMHDECQEVFGE